MALVAVVVLAAVAVLRLFPRGTLWKAQREGVISVGYAVEAPYAFLTGDGKVTGESPEVARVIAQRLGIPRIEWRLTEFDRLIDELEARRFDVIAAGMFITPERAQRVLFSSPTFQVRTGILVRRGNPRKLHSIRDVSTNETVRIAVLRGSVEEKKILDLGVPRERVVSVPDADSGYGLVCLGRADALMLSAPTLRWMAARDAGNGTEMVALDDAAQALVPESGLGAFAFRMKDRALRDAWNAELAKFIGSDEHRRLVGPWGFTRAEFPGVGSANGSVPGE